MMFEASANAAITLEILGYNYSQMTIRIGGSFDEDSYGTLPGYLGLKHNWNGVSKSEWFTWSNGYLAGYLNIGGEPVSQSTLDMNFYCSNDSYARSDSYYIANQVEGGGDTAFTAGTTVDGVLVIGYDSEVDEEHGFTVPIDELNLSLLSGIGNGSSIDYVRKEADATISKFFVDYNIYTVGQSGPLVLPESLVPEPAHYAGILSLGILSFAAFGRRRRKSLTASKD